MQISNNSIERIEGGIALVTGGAGFIGSHLVDTLIANGLNVRVLDNLSTGNLSKLINSKSSKNFQFVKKDLNDFESLSDSLIDVKTVFHLAANPEVKMGYDHPEISYKENIQNTFHLLEQIRKSDVETIVFSSTATVYGETELLPTPEDHGPLFPISPYGASKLACEALISSYCHNYGISGLIFRFANIVGSRSSHGVVWDFIKKLKKDEKKLEVLGDGKQSKSYLHVSDCINSFFFCLGPPTKQIEIFNVGNVDRTNVMIIAKIVCKNMNLADVKILTTGGDENGRGWKGDVKQMHLDITKLKKLGWTPTLSSSDSIERASKEILGEYKQNE